MLTTAAAFLIIVWPGHNIPMQPYPTVTACEATIDTLHRADRDRFEGISGFHAWCEPDGPNAAACTS